MKADKVKTTLMFLSIFIILLINMMAIVVIGMADMMIVWLLVLSVIDFIIAVYEIYLKVKRKL